MIILNWNGAAIIQRCLEHVFAQTYQPLEVIVIDNGSTDGSYEHVERDWETRLELIRNAENRGFTGGMNQGIAAAHGSFLLLLNSDVFLRKDYLDQAMCVILRPGNASIGAVGGKLFYFADGRKTNRLNHVGFFLKARMAVKNSTNTEMEEKVFGPSGSCPLVRRQMLDDVCLSPGQWFDDAYFAYNEDIDLWFRAQLLGWQVAFAPGAVGWHIHSASVGGKLRLYERDSLYQFHALKNRYMTILKNYPVGLFIVMWPALLLAEGLTLVFCLMRSRSTLANLFEAQRYLVTHWSEIRVKRIRIQSRRRTSVGYLLTLFRGF